MENKKYVVMSSEVFKLITKLPYDTVAHIMPTVAQDIRNNSLTLDVVEKVQKIAEGGGPENASKVNSELNQEENNG